MRFSRVLADGCCTTFDPDVAVVDASADTLGRLVAVFRDLFAGVVPQGRVFAEIDHVEFEIAEEMIPLIGERLAGRVGVIDPTIPPPLDATTARLVDLRATVLRAASETLGAEPPVLDRAHIDGARQATSKRLDGRTGGDVARFDAVLADRQRHLATSTPATPDEIVRATLLLRSELDTTLGGAASDRDQRRVAMMSAAGAAEVTRRWLATHLDRGVTPIVKSEMAALAGGVDVLGAIPAVVDLRRVCGAPPGADALATAFANHRRRVQFIVLPGDDANRDWLVSALDR